MSNKISETKVKPEEIVTKSFNFKQRLDELFAKANEIQQEQMQLQQKANELQANLFRIEGQVAIIYDVNPELKPKT